MFPPPSPTLLQRTTDSGLARLRLGMGVVGLALTSAYLAVLPLIGS